MIKRKKFHKCSLIILYPPGLATDNKNYFSDSPSREPKSSSLEDLSFDEKEILDKTTAGKKLGKSYGRTSSFTKTPTDSTSSSNSISTQKTTSWYKFI